MMDQGIVDAGSGKKAGIKLSGTAIKNGDSSHYTTKMNIILDEKNE